MKLGIFATNISAGGGLTHLSELLNHWRPHLGFSEGVVVWGTSELACRVRAQPGLTLHVVPSGASSFFRKWLPRRSHECDLLFVPGGTYLGRSIPYVAMSQNMLVFDRVERGRYREFGARLRLELLNRIQKDTLNRAAGIIYLTETAKNVIGRSLLPSNKPAMVIPHGVDPRFFRAVGTTAPQPSTPLRALYVSVIAPYKHQWNVVEAVARVNEGSTRLCLDLVGPAHAPSLKRLRDTAVRFDTEGRWLTIRGDVDHGTIHKIYHDADLFIFGSSCENLPNILIEAMASRLPIASSRIEPMPEVLGSAGVYFDPASPADIAAAIERLVADAELRSLLAEQAQTRARTYSWHRCAIDTFTFLNTVAATVRDSRQVA